MKIALVIPTYKPHFIYLEGLCQNISEQTRLPDLVVIRASSCDTGEAGAQLVALSKKPWPFPLQILETPAQQFQAQNRNEGLAAVPSEFDAVSFFDSDDWMHPRRLEIIEQFFLQGAEAVLHQYEVGSSLPNWKIYTNPVECVWDSISLQKESAIQERNQIVSRSVILQGYPNEIPGGKEITFLRPVPMDDNLEQDLPMACGHISVLRRLFDLVKFEEEALGYEDVKFLSDIAVQHRRIACIRAELSYYTMH